MSDIDDQPTTEQPQEGEKFDAEYVARLRREAAKYRTDAKANADAAKRLAELENAQKSEAQRAADQVAAAQAEVAGIPAKVSETLRAHLVALHKIDDEDAELFLTATDPELLIKQANRLVSGKTTRQTTAPREGNTPTDTSSDLRTFARQVFGGDQ